VSGRESRTGFARLLRAGQTRGEALLWRELRDRRLDGWKFRRQAPILRYVADFLCVDARLVVEIDGPAHLERSDRDALRAAEIEAAGYRIVRFTSAEVEDGLAQVIEALRAELRLPRL
jgi:very-short-patch-repair endonuclease